MPSNALRRNLGLLSASLFVLAHTSELRAEVLLRLKFREGQELEQRISTDTRTSLSGLGPTVETEQSFEIESVAKVRKLLPDGSAECELRFERIRARMHLPPEGEQEYDSKERKKFSGPLSAKTNDLFDALLSSRVSYRLTPLGEIKDLKVPEAILRQLRGEGAPAGGFFSEKSLEQLFQANPLLPEKAVSPGDSWNEELEIEQPYGKLTVVTTCEYQGPEKRDGRELERIGVRTDVKLAAGADPRFNAHLRSFKGSGKALFDKEAGRFEEFEIAQRNELEFVPRLGQSLTSVSDTKMVVKVSERTGDYESR